MFRQRLFSPFHVRRLPGAALRILLIAGLALWAAWMGLGRGYREGQDHGYTVGRISGYRAGYRVGVRDGVNKARTAGATSETDSVATAGR